MVKEFFRKSGLLLINLVHHFIIPWAIFMIVLGFIYLKSNKDAHYVPSIFWTSALFSLLTWFIAFQLEREKSKKFILIVLANLSGGLAFFAYKIHMQWSGAGSHLDAMIPSVGSGICFVLMLACLAAYHAPQRKRNLQRA